MTTFASRYGPWAVVAGASEGLGAEFARQVAKRGLNVAIVARRAEALEVLAAERGLISGSPFGPSRSIWRRLMQHRELRT